MVIHDHHAGKKQNISLGFSVFLSVGHLGKRRWVTSEKRRSSSFDTFNFISHAQAFGREPNALPTLCN
jgi:hypothetical protein